VSNGQVDELPVSGMFLGIGHEPNAKMFAGQIDLDEDGYIKTTGNVLTTQNGVVVRGVFACGDVQDRRYRQAITAAGSGCMAALEAEKYLEALGH
jgi:thioredoxin reductase (NADPH)